MIIIIIIIIIILTIITSAAASYGVTSTSSFEFTQDAVSFLDRYVCVCVCMCVCMYLCIYVCMYVCMCDTIDTIITIIYTNNAYIL
jgi:hypothetical protein